jgi:hypothetical protein
LRDRQVLGPPEVGFAAALNYIVGRAPPQIAGLHLDSQYRKLLDDLL